MHRLQGVRGGVQAVEPAAGRRLRLLRAQLRPHRALSAESWRHVKFVEQFPPPADRRLSLDVVPADAGSADG
ncbi:MAG: hypothetical protein U0736_11215 [Gemmataceae bacterium]